MWPGKIKEPVTGNLRGFVSELSGARVTATDPPTSARQQRYMGAALARKRAGTSRSSDPEMTEAQLREYAKKPKGGSRR